MNDNTTKKLIIQPGCITCGLCEYLAPDVFEVSDISHVKKDFNSTEHKDAIEAAIKSCPVNVIIYHDEL